MNPIPGKVYTVVAGDSLSLIAARAYGDSSLWPRIWEANQTSATSDDPNLIFPGENVLIPLLAERRIPAIINPDSDPNAMFLIINGREIQPVSGRIIRTLDTVANGFSAVIPWIPGEDSDMDEAIAPYAYSLVTVWLGTEKVMDGVLYNTTTANSDGITATLNGWTGTADLVDSKLKPPYEFNKITLNDLILRLIRPFGFTVIFDTDTGGEFDRVTAEQGDTVESFLVRLAKQRGVLLTVNTDGDLVVTRANVKGAPVASLEEGVTTGVFGWGSVFDGRKRFFVYRAMGRGPSGSIESKITDPSIPRARFQTVRADDATSGGVEAAARWARNSALADALTFDLTVQDWRTPAGNFWVEGDIVTVISASMFIPSGFNFLLKRVEYKMDEKGRSTVLSFVPPTVYTDGEIVEPWSI